MFLDLIAVGTHKAKLALVALENLSRTAHRISCACPVPSTAPSGCHQAWQFPTAAQHGEPELLRGLWWSVYGWGGASFCPCVTLYHFSPEATQFGPESHSGFHQNRPVSRVLQRLSLKCQTEFPVLGNPQPPPLCTWLFMSPWMSVLQNLSLSVQTSNHIGHELMQRNGDTKIGSLWLHESQCKFRYC